MIDIFFVGGGTAGHVLPNIFLIDEIKKRNSDIKIGYIGSRDSIEKKIFLEHYGNDLFFEISSDKLRRYMTYKNFLMPLKVLKGVFDSLIILKKHKPKLIFAKGGFICVPVILAAYILRIDVFIHESDFSIGLANKISMPLSKKIYVSFQNTINQNKKFNHKMTLVGPILNKKIIYDENFDINKLGFSEKLKTIFDNKKKILLVTGGSLGSNIINNIIYKNYEYILQKYNIIHICGKGNLNPCIKKSNIKNYILEESINNDEMIFLMKKSNIVISRAGINTVYELIFLKKASILIPLSSKVSRGDQIENAFHFFNQGLCDMIIEEELTDDLILSKLDDDLFESKYLEKLKNHSIEIGTDKIALEILDKIK